MLTIACSVISLIVGMLVGSIFAGEYARKTIWNMSLQVEKQAILLLQFQGATRPIVEEIEAAGEDTDWSGGPETHRVYYWHELESLAKVLKESEHVTSK